jgi:hypothetical protein
LIPFAKISTALTDSKSNNIKTKICLNSQAITRSLATMAQLSLSPWQELYDPNTNDIVSNLPAKRKTQDWPFSYFASFSILLFD